MLHKKINFFALTGADNGPRYLSYLPITAKSWETFSGTRLVCGLVVDDLEEDLIRLVGKYCEVIPIPRLLGVDPRVQGKINRLWLSQLERFQDSVLTIADLDMVPLSDKRNALLRESASANYIIKWGYDHPSYQDIQEIGKWPMDGTTGYGSFFKKIVNPNDLNFQSLVEVWKDYKIDCRENPFNPPNNFSDESLLRAITDEAGDSLMGLHISRKQVESSLFNGRVDKAYRLPLRTKGIFEKSVKFEFHGPTPFPADSYFGRALMEQINLPIEEYAQYRSELEINTKSLKK